MSFQPSKKMHKNHNSDQSQVMSLALFLLLLAFFIVLSTMIEFDEEKVSKLKLGLEEAFVVSKVEGGYGELDQGDKIGESISQTFGEVEQLMRLNIGIVSLQKFEQDSIMVITVSADDLLSASQDTLNTLANILAYSKNEEVRFELEALYGLGNSLVNVSENERREATKKMGQFARSMTNFALPTHAMSIGLLEGKKDMVDLVLYAHRKDKPLTKFNPAQIKRGFGGMQGGG